MQKAQCIYCVCVKVLSLKLDTFFLFRFSCANSVSSGQVFMHFTFAYSVILISLTYSEHSYTQD